MRQWSEKMLEIISVLLKSVETCFVSYVVYPREHSMGVWEECVFFYGGISCSKGFPHSSVGKESACNAGDPGLIPVSGRSAGEGIGYPLQYSWAFLVAELVKNLPAVRETWVRSLGWEDPRGESLSTPVFWPGEFHGRPLSLFLKYLTLLPVLALYGTFSELH